MPPGSAFNQPNLIACPGAMLSPTTRHLPINPLHDKPFRKLFIVCMLYYNAVKHMRAIFVKDITGTEWEDNKELGEGKSHYGSESPTSLYKLPEPIYIYDNTHYDLNHGFRLKDLTRPGAKGKFTQTRVEGLEIVCATEYFVLSYMGGKLHGITWKPGEKDDMDKYVGLKKSRAKKYEEYYRLRKEAHILEIQFSDWVVNVFPAYPDGRCMAVGVDICHFEHADTFEGATKIALDALEMYAKESEPTFLFE